MHTPQSAHRHSVLALTAHDAHRAYRRQRRRDTHHRPKSGRTEFTFCVDDVVHATLTYDPDANQETCDTYP